jgi:hypothetical protein
MKTLTELLEEMKAESEWSYDFVEWEDDEYICKTHNRTRKKMLACVEVIRLALLWTDPEHDVSDWREQAQIRLEQALEEK